MIIGAIPLGLLCLACACGVAANDKGTNPSEARAAIEANMRTAAGKAYDEQIGKEFFPKYMVELRGCKKQAGSDLDSFWFLLKLDKDGAVSEVLLHPETKLGSCARQSILKGKFSPPPRGEYWIGVYMKITR